MGLLRLVFTGDGHRVVVGVIRELMTKSESQAESQARRNRSRKNQDVSISSDSVYDSVTYDPVKTRKKEPIARPGIKQCHCFILPLLLATLTMQFSLDRKRRSHQQHQCSASDSVGLIFTRSYRSTLLITTPTTNFVPNGGSVAEWFRALHLKSRGPWFKSSTLLLSGFVLGSPEFNSSTSLVSLPLVGILNSLCAI